VTKLEQLQALERAASPAPFVAESVWTGKHSGADVVYAADRQAVCECDEHDGGLGGGHRNVELIVALRNAAPQLLALWSACEAARTAKCSHDVIRNPLTETVDWCLVDNHTPRCPVAITRAAVAAVLERGLP
jgi:hypothetical protein